MGYYIRFISVDTKKISLSEIEIALKSLDSDYQIDRDEINDAEGVLMWKNETYAQLEINEKGDSIFEDEIEMLKERGEEAEGQNKQRVLDVLDQAAELLFIRVLQQGRGWDETVEKIGFLLDVLDTSRKGLVHFDNEGFYSAAKLIFEVE